MGRDLALADRLRARGLVVVEVAGWQTRGKDNLNAMVSVNHHTAGGATGNAPSLGVCINGRAGIPGPLANTLQARDNTIYVIAAGTANNAGLGGWAGFSGNSRTNGHEVENVGTVDEPWRPDQIETMCLVHAAWCDDPSNGLAAVARVCQHFEWTTRKIDAHDINGDDFRGRVGALLGGGQPQPMPQPSPPAPPPPVPSPPGRVPVTVNLPQLSEGTAGLHVAGLQAMHNVKNELPQPNRPPLAVDGQFGSRTKAEIVLFQRWAGLTPDGIVGPQTWAALLEYP